MENNLLNENIEERLRCVSEELQDAISLIIILENDLLTQKSEDIYIRAIKVIHSVIKSAQNALLKVMKTD